MAEIEYPTELVFLFQDAARYKILFGGRGGMKCLALGTKIIMFDGSLKQVENVKENDLLMGPDSLPRKVSNITRGIDMMYEVKQTSGIKYICNSAHILSLKKSDSAINDVGNRYPNYPKITNINVVEASKQTTRWKSHFRGYKAGLIKFDEKEILINPWYLGMWLGDGKSDDTVVYSADEEVLNFCKAYALYNLGMKVVIYNQPNNKSVGIAIRRNVGFHGRINNLWQFFKKYDLFDNKHIPFDYLSNSEEIRLEVLAGLIDSDGTRHSNGYDIYQTNERLARDIKYLADNLGFRTNFSHNKTVCGNNGVEGKAYRVSINGDTWRIPCKVKRKIIRQEEVRKNKDFLLSQIEINCIGEGEYAGFSLDGDGLFLLEDGTVTHNTESIACALIILARQRKLRIACFREIQKSIDESVHATIANRIIEMGWQDDFDIQDKKIICKKTGSEFIFFGLRYNINSIKSIARIDIAWIEEATNVSKTSWDKLTPTIRGRGKNVVLENLDQNQGGPFGKGTEIWISFNPELDTDETYKRFILKREQYAPDFVTNDNGEQIRYAFVKMLSYKDNPWLPDDLKLECELLKATDEDEWMHVWGGHTRQTLTGAIYAKEIKKVLLDRRRGKVPYDASRPVHTFWDLGHDDFTSIWCVQQVGVEYNLINYFQDRLEKIPYYIKYLQDLQYNYGFHYLPHDGDNETLASRSTVKQVRDVYPGKVKVVPRVSRKVVGIRAARVVFDLCNFDEENTADGWQCLCHYQYKVNEDGKWSQEPDHNEFSHGADAFQTFALSLKPEQKTKPPKIVTSGRILPLRTSTGWMRS